MKYFLLLLLLLVCMAASALAADFHLTGSWISTSPQNNDLPVEIEFFDDGKVVLLVTAIGAEQRIESAYKIEQSGDDSLVHIMVYFPEDTKEKLLQYKLTSVRITARVVDQHTLSVQSLESLGESGESGGLDEVGGQVTLRRLLIGRVTPNGEVEIHEQK